jgi:hypothetical protein
MDSDVLHKPGESSGLEEVQHDTADPILTNQIAVALLYGRYNLLQTTIIQFSLVFDVQGALIYIWLVQHWVTT